VVSRLYTLYSRPRIYHVQPLICPRRKYFLLEHFLCFSTLVCTFHSTVTRVSNARSYVPAIIRPGADKFGFTFQGFLWDRVEQRVEKRLKATRKRSVHSEYFSFFYTFQPTSMAQRSPTHSPLAPMASSQFTHSQMQGQSFGMTPRRARQGSPWQFDSGNFQLVCFLSPMLVILI
jgi:hypothetical protein